MNGLKIGTDKKLFNVPWRGGSRERIDKIY
jgi:hypothetical protein